MKPPKRAPLFGVNMPVTPSDKTDVTAPEESSDHRSTSGRDMMGQIQSVIGMADVAPEEKSEDPSTNADHLVEMTKTPYTEKELKAGVTYDRVREGPLKLSCFEIPAQINELNTLLAEAGTPQLQGSVKLKNTLDVTLSGDRMFVLVWYSDLLYPRSKSKHSTTNG